jgi:rhamnose utilization protein RhaD (predicted bifunctional aldolase and dehydrogenase)/NAD(P)-dependent dehydrogenase (short-subunit alcohol dehydrogenase family)
MRSLWNDKEAGEFKGDLNQRVYTSRLLGRDPSLVLHGGGNTSVKVTRPNLFGENEDLLLVKGSGWDLATIEAPGFAPVRMDHLLKLAKLDTLSDPQMSAELRAATIDPAAPAPSVETILHAILPFKFVDHTHTDALLSVTNTPNGAAYIKDIYGDSVVVIPYVMPGFDLAKLCAKLFPEQRNAKTVGMVLMNHGMFSWGATAKDSYERMIALVDKAERFLKKKKAWSVPVSKATPAAKDMRLELARLRLDVSKAAGAPVILSTFSGPEYLDFARRRDIKTLSQQGSATPDHVLRTKCAPMLGRDVAAFVADYKRYFDAHSKKAKQKLTMLDPAPRVILDRDFGMAVIGKSMKDAQISADIYRHTIDVQSRAQALDKWKALPRQDLFDVEYWDLEQAKLKKQGSAPRFQGEVVLITGAASGIGKACAEAFLKNGASIVALDIDKRVDGLIKSPDFLGLPCDVTKPDAIKKALETAVRKFGGIDMLVLNAGIFPSSKQIGAMDLAEWQRTMRINLDANLLLMKEAHPLLKLAPKGGRVVVNASKNVPAPGPGAAAYSASKAALTQLARVAALEWGADNIRVNVLHPNAVFDTGVWTPEVLTQRAKHYGLSVADYKKSNVLHTEIGSKDVALLAMELCGPAFAKTTGAQIPIDGGNDRVI